MIWPLHPRYEHTLHRVVRKRLFGAGGVQMILAQIATTILMAITFRHTSPPIYSIILIEAFICMFTAGFAYSWGPLGWLVRTEFPFLTVLPQSDDAIQ